MEFARAAGGDFRFEGDAQARGGKRVDQGVAVGLGGRKARCGLRLGRNEGCCGKEEGYEDFHEMEI